MKEAVRWVALISGQELWKLSAMGRGTVGTWEASGPRFSGPETEKHVHRSHHKEGTMTAVPERMEQGDRPRINEIFERVRNRLLAVLTADLERAATRADFQDEEHATSYSFAVLAATIDVVASHAAGMVVTTDGFGTDNQMDDTIQISERLRPQLFCAALDLMAGEKERRRKNGGSPRIGVNARPN
jgi:hypothetical protein